jgi:hypothetical protein
LSDRKFQEIAWFPNNHGLMSSFLEDILAVIDDSAITYFQKKGKTIFGAKADSALDELEKAIDLIDENDPVENIIDMAEMEIVRQKASNALSLVKESTSDMSDVMFLAWVHIPIIGKDITRGAIAEELPDGNFKILKTYDAWHTYPKGEKWKFKPRDIVNVKVEDYLDEGGNITIRALEKIR